MHKTHLERWTQQVYLGSISRDIFQWDWDRAWVCTSNKRLDDADDAVSLEHFLYFYHGCEQKYILDCMVFKLGSSGVKPWGRDLHKEN